MFNGAGGLIGTTITTHPTPHGQYSPVQRQTTQNWNRTLNYKTKRKTQGYLVTNPYTHDFLGVSGSLFQGTFRVANPASPERVEVDIGGLVVPASVDNCEAQSNANTQYLDLVTDAQYRVLSAARDMRVNIPVLLGEARQTARMIGDLANTLGRAYGAFRKGNFGRAARLLKLDKPFVTDKILANNWLAYQYGWRPLLSDAVGAATTLYDYFEGNGKWGGRTRISRTAKGSAKSGSYVQPDYYVQGWNNVSSWEREPVVARAGLLLEIEHTSAALASQLGVGLSDPLLTAWELTPFSFVFDWFVDIGGWLEARSSLQGFKVLDGYYSWRVVYKGSSKLKYASWIYPVKNCDPSWKFQVRRYRREFWTGGLLSVRTPLYDSLNGSRIGTSAALWIQRLKGDRAPNDPYPRAPSPRKRAKGKRGY
jgi:hypothetical protein